MRMCTYFDYTPIFEFGSWGRGMFSFIENCQIVLQKWLYNFILQPAFYKGCSPLVLWIFLKCTHISGYEMVCLCCSGLHFSFAHDDDEHFCFDYSFISLCELLFQVLCLCRKWVAWFYIVYLWKFFMCFLKKCCFHIYVLQIFSPVGSLLISFS